MSTPTWQPPEPPPSPPNKRSRLVVLGVTGVVVLAIVGIACIALVLREYVGTPMAGEGNKSTPGSSEPGNGGPSDPGSKDPNGSKSSNGEPKGLVDGYRGSGKPGRGVGAGPADAKVVVELYEDFSCPHCGAFEAAGASRTLQTYVDAGKIRTVHYPVTLQSFEQNGYGNDKAANAYLCAVDKGAGDRFAATLWKEQGRTEGRWTDEYLMKWGSMVAGGDFAACQKEMRYQSYLDSVDRQMSDNGISGTPTVLVNGKPITLDLDQAKSVGTLKQAIDDALAGNR